MRPFDLPAFRSGPDTLKFALRATAGFVAIALGIWAGVKVAVQIPASPNLDWGILFLPAILIVLGLSILRFGWLRLTQRGQGERKPLGYAGMIAGLIAFGVVYYVLNDGRLSPVHILASTALAILAAMFFVWTRNGGRAED